MDGLLNLNKSTGSTSFAAVQVVRRLSGERRVGHGGTLDPQARGVLPIFLGKATRIIEYLEGTAKVYRADLLLGIETDTYDKEGRVQGNWDPSAVTLRAVEEHLTAFEGAIRQIPPMFSALHHKGRRLYELARAGVEVEREARSVTIHRLGIVDWQSPRLTLSITCSKGTYVRSLAHDLGRALGCGAILEGLVRQQSGPFRIEEAQELEGLEQAFSSGESAGLLLPADYPLASWPALRLDAVGEATVRAGRTVPLSCVVASEPGVERDTLFWPSPTTGLARTYDAAGRFIAVLHWDDRDGAWRPRKVFT